MNNLIKKLRPCKCLDLCYRIAFALSVCLGLALLPALDALAQKTVAGLTTKHIKAKKPPSRNSKPIAKAVSTVPLDQANELEIIHGEAILLHNALHGDPDDKQSLQKLAELALRATREAERALSRGDEALFTAYREQIKMQFAGTQAGLKNMADRGVGAAEYALGILALHGILEEHDVARACAHFTAALDKRFNGAKFRSAQCLEETDPKRARDLLIEAADSGHVAASETLGRACLEGTPQDIDCAYSRLERAATDGRTSARTLLGWMYAKGVGGRTDLALAVKYYQESAKKGDPSARNNLGELYESGRGVAKNEALALKYYKAAAEGGFPPAQFNLGRLYAAGKGTKQDFTAARHWLGEAANGGVEPAQRILDILNQDAEPNLKPPAPAN